MVVPGMFGKPGAASPPHGGRPSLLTQLSNRFSGRGGGGDNAAKHAKQAAREKAYVGSFRWKVFQTFENADYREGPWPRPTAKIISLVVMATIMVSTFADSGIMY